MSSGKKKRRNVSSLLEEGQSAVLFKLYFGSKYQQSQISTRPQADGDLKRERRFGPFPVSISISCKIIKK